MAPASLPALRETLCRKKKLQIASTTPWLRSLEHIPLAACLSQNIPPLLNQLNFYYIGQGVESKSFLDPADANDESSSKRLPSMLVKLWEHDP